MRADGCVVDVALVHRRLSIIDHAGGHQPMVLQVPRGAEGGEGSRPSPGRLLSREEIEAHNWRALAEGHVGSSVEGGRDRPEPALEALSSHDRIAVVFNGCIYNHRELRAELQRAGHVFGSDHSDTETLIHGWRDDGLEVGDDRSDGECFLTRTRGMFVFALWSSQTAELVLARDRFGEKPLHLTSLEAGVHAFCSTAAGLTRLRVRAHRGVHVARAALLRWLRFGFDATAPTGESQLPAGGFARMGEQIDVCAYAPRWSTWKDGRGAVAERPLSVSEVDRAIAAAVSGQAEADVPLGCFLSGGVDSSLVARAAIDHLGRLDTFTVRMPDDRYDESGFAERVAGLLGCTHHTIDVSPRPTEELGGLIPELGLPFGDSSLLPALWVSRAARQHVKVALGGDGGDELFLGYDRYRAARLLSRFGSALGRLPASLLSRRDPKSRSTRLARLIDAANSGDLTDFLAIYSREDRDKLLGPSAQQEDAAWTLEELRAFDLETYLPQDLLRKADTASMHVPMELRSPMLDPGVAELAARGSLESLMPRGQRKGLLRQVARKYLPAEIVDRPKMGFAIPIGEWFRSDYGGLRTMLLDHLNSREPFGPSALGIELNMGFIRQMLDEHLGTGPSGLVRRDHSQRLYMLLVLSVWAKWLGGVTGSQGA